MRRLVFILLGASAAFGQNTLTINASRQVNAQPDQSTIGIYVNTDASQTLDQVLALLKPANISATDFASLQAAGSGQLQWTFNTPVPLSNLTAVAAALNGLKSAGVSYFVEGATASSQATAQACNYGALIGDAQTQANKLAAAAGVTLGPIVSLAQESNGAVGNPFPIWDPLTGVIPVSRITYLVSSIVTTPTPSCALAVQFQITR